MRRLLLAAAVTAVAVTGWTSTPASADHDTCHLPDRTVYGEETNAVYVDVRYVGDPYVDMVWVYAEDNGVSGLQRGGYSATLGSEEPCPDGGKPDLLIF